VSVSIGTTSKAKVRRRGNPIKVELCGSIVVDVKGIGDFEDYCKVFDAVERIPQQYDPTVGRWTVDFQSPEFRQLPDDVKKRISVRLSS
jgi:hypothetical protein